MKTNEILNLDYRVEENKKIIQNVLRKIKPLSKYSDEKVPLEAIEKVIKIISEKYKIWPKPMKLTGVYSVEVEDDNFKSLGKVYGMCVYEVFAKLVIKMYSEIRKK